jgi:tripartite-type tricarboxylate transporter receptor subunit TctC
LLPDLLSGRVPMMFENLAVMLPHIRKGAMKPLAVSSAKRSAQLPNLPTVAETGMGLEKFEVLGWFAVLAPAKTSPEILAFLNAEINRMTTKPSVIAKFQELGAEPMSGTQQHAAAYIRDEQNKWSKVIRDAGIKAQ